MKGIIQRYPYQKALLILFLSGFAVQACAPSISQFNETAYQQAISLKVVSIDLIRHAEESYTIHESSVKTLKLELKKAYEFANGLPNNDYSASLWKTMIDPDEQMLGGLIQQWQDTGTLSGYFIDEAVINIAAGFDIIIGLESGKIARGR